WAAATLTGDGFSPTKRRRSRSGGRSASVSTRAPSRSIVIRCEPGPGRARRASISSVTRPSLPGAGQPIAQAVLGGDVRAAGRDRLELEAEVPDRHPQEVDVGVVAGAPDGGEDLAMRDQLTGMLDEIGEQPELGRRQPDVLALQSSPVVIEVDHEIAMLEPSRPIRRRR